jgi:hypothetical protein
MEKIYNLYIIANIKNDKIYIGKTPGNLVLKMASHKYSYRTHGITSKLSKAFEDIGVDSFFIKPLEQTPPMSNLQASILLKQKYVEFDSITHGYNGYFDKHLKNVIKNSVTSFGNIHNVVK